MGVDYFILYFFFGVLIVFIDFPFIRPLIANFKKKIAFSIIIILIVSISIEFFNPTQFSFVNTPFFPTHNFIISQFLILTIDLIEIS